MELFVLCLLTRIMPGFRHRLSIRYIYWDTCYAVYLFVLSDELFFWCSNLYLWYDWYCWDICLLFLSMPPTKYSTSDLPKRWGIIGWVIASRSWNRGLEHCKPESKLIIIFIPAVDPLVSSVLQWSWGQGVSLAWAPESCLPKRMIELLSLYIFNFK